MIATFAKEDLEATIKQSQKAVRAFVMFVCKAVFLLVLAPQLATK